jgi:hypothetical protein
MIKVKKTASVLLFNSYGASRSIEVSEGTEFPLVKEVGDNCVMCSYGGDNEFVVLPSAIIMVSEIDPDIKKALEEKIRGKIKETQETREKKARGTAAYDVPATDPEKAKSIMSAPIDEPATPPVAPLPQPEPLPAPEPSKGPATTSIEAPVAKGQPDPERIKKMMDDVEFLDDELLDEEGAVDVDESEKAIVEVTVNEALNTEKMLTDYAKKKANKMIKGAPQTPEAMQRYLMLVNRLKNEAVRKSEMRPIDAVQPGRFFLAFVPAKIKGGDRKEKGRGRSLIGGAPPTQRTKHVFATLFRGKIIDFAKPTEPIYMDEIFSTSGLESVALELGMTLNQAKPYMTTILNEGQTVPPAMQLYMMRATQLANDRIASEPEGSYFNMDPKVYSKYLTPENIEGKLNEQKSRENKYREEVEKRVGKNAPSA